MDRAAERGGESLVGDGAGPRRIRADRIPLACQSQTGRGPPSPAGGSTARTCAPRSDGPAARQTRTAAASSAAHRHPARARCRFAPKRPARVRWHAGPRPPTPRTPAQKVAARAPLLSDQFIVEGPVVTDGRAADKHGGWPRSRAHRGNQTARGEHTALENALFLRGGPPPPGDRFARKVDHGLCAVDL